MPHITLQFDPAIGPILSINVGFPQSAKQPVGGPPQPETVNFLIDTGASVSSINPATAAKLGLPVLGLVRVVSTTQSMPVNEYLTDLILPIGVPQLILRDWRVLEFPMAGSGSGSIGGLLGRDLLRSGVFITNGPHGFFTLAL